jgi:hypothetical protein
MSDLFGQPATRRTDPATSHQAAEKVAPFTGTIREWVLAFALRAGESGFIDDDLVTARTDHPESSFRKRRTELAQENWLIDTGRQIDNRWGNGEIVWVHRDFAANPPPIKERAAPAQKDALKSEARAMAAQLAQFADSMRKEGRMMLSAKLAEAARIMAGLSR